MFNKLSIFVVILLIPCVLSAQTSVKEKEEFNTVNKQIGIDTQEYVKKIQQGRGNPGSGRMLFRNRGSVGLNFFRLGFGVMPVYQRMLSWDLSFVGELGYYTTATKDIGHYSSFVTWNRVNGEFLNANFFPLYAGLKKGFYIRSVARKFYPYIGAGAGPVVAYGQNRQSQYDNIYSNFTYAPSAYLLVGFETYSSENWFLNFNVRYRHLKFNDSIANNRDYSGLSFSIGFGRGFSGTYYLK